MSEPAPPRIVAVVLHYCGAAFVETAVGALRASTLPPAQILVVDNASPDGSAEALRTLPVDVLALDANLGYAGAMNRAVAHLGGDHYAALLLLTQDCLLDPAAVERLHARLAASASTGVAGPVLAQLGERDRVHSAGGLLDRRTWRVVHRAAGTRLAALADVPPTADWLDGACLLFRPQAVADVFPLDERYFLYYEDVDMALTLHRHGWDVGVAGDAVAWQHASVVPTYLGTRNELLFLSRWAPRSLVLRRAGAVVVRIARDLAATALGRRRPWRQRLAGLRDFTFGRYPATLPAERLVRDAWWQ